MLRIKLIHILISPIVLSAGLFLYLAAGSEVHASLSAIDTERLLPGKDKAQLCDDLKVLQTVAGVWSPEWRHELPKVKAVSLAQSTLRKIDDLLAANPASPGELLLLKGLTAHYAYNLDENQYFNVAVDSLQKARKALPADCRPLWFLGNHYTKAADPEKGVPFLQQAVSECGESLPLPFWEDYAYAAVLAAMPATGYYALDRVKVRNGGVLTEKARVAEEGVKNRLGSPVQGKEYVPMDIWHFGEHGRMARFANWMYGFMIDVPGNWYISPFGVRNGRSGIAVTLPKKGKWPPPLKAVLLVSPALPDTVAEEVLRTFVSSAGNRSFSMTEGPVSIGEKFLWLESRQKKGSRIAAGILRRPQPAYPGLLLESPQNIPKSKDNPQIPSYYTPIKRLTRLHGELDYLIMIEGAPAAFDRDRADLELLLRHLVIE